jgi:two-component system LytT family response regulator
MNPIRALVIDDEFLAREETKAALREFPNVEVLGEAGTLADAKDMVQSLKPDGIFLDIQMPRGLGFEILDGLEIPPLVILITAYEEHALKAYDYDAVDYLLKPIQPEKMKRALERLSERIAARPLPQKKQAAFDSQPNMISLRNGTVLLNPDDILAVEADGNYSKIFLKGNQREFIRTKMSEWEELLPSEQFVRIERKRIVQISAIRQLVLQADNAQFRLGDIPAPFVVGRRAAVNLKKLFSKPV